MVAQLNDGTFESVETTLISVGVITHSLLSAIIHRFLKAPVAKCIIGSILRNVIYRLPQIRCVAK